jgi:hypothetical protein
MPGLNFVNLIISLFVLHTNIYLEAHSLVIILPRFHSKLHSSPFFDLLQFYLVLALEIRLRPPCSHFR